MDNKIYRFCETENIYLKYHCEICNLNTSNKTNFNKHLLTPKHLNLSQMCKNDQNTDKKNAPSEIKKYFCKYCDYNTCVKCNFERHLNSKSHTDQVAIEEKVQKTNTVSNKKYVCECCDYITTVKSNYTRHVKSKTHTDKIAIREKLQKTQKICYCGKIYKFTTGLSKHKKRCREAIMKEEYSLENQQIITTNNNITNNNITNNIVNLNIFLNEQCKDALNLTDVIKSLQITSSDIDYTKDNGLIEGISKILINELKKLGTYNRPIHCTDSKRDVLYIKDNDEWNKEESDDKLSKTITDIADKQCKSLHLWQNENPNWNTTERGKENWVKAVKSVTEHINNKKKIIKSISKEVKVPKEIKK